MRRVKTVFTNGCFDLLHAGHIELLETARSYGDRLIVGINSDKSVRSIKGEDRPVISELNRKRILESLSCVDEVMIYESLTPEELIRDIKPDVLVKGGDWQESEIIGASFVKGLGGEVHTVPFKDGISTSDILDKIRRNSSEGGLERHSEGRKDLILGSLDEHEKVFLSLRAVCEDIRACGEMLSEVLLTGGKILICGNGGSAADAQHMAAELVGRYESERKGLPVIALTTDSSGLTAIANDYGYEHVFSRQIEALAAPGDALVAISTSGNSGNILQAVMAARAKGCKVIGLTGRDGKKLAALCDRCVKAPSARTSRIQEVHSMLIHIWCEIIEGKWIK